MAEQETTREQRATTTRANEARPKTWVPVGTLPVPQKDDGYTYRWLRKSAYGIEDPTNMSKKLREGWEPVNPKEHPELALFLDPRQRQQATLVEVGGLILGRMPREMAEARTKYYEQVTKSQMVSIDQQLANEQQDARMPIFSNRQTKVTGFGRGS